MIRRQVNWWLGALIIISLAVMPWWFTLILFLAGLNYGFTAALPLALLADLAYGTKGSGWLGFQFWFTAAIIIFLLGRQLINHFLNLSR